ncbi:hypothetical protein TNCV_1115581 [Trichonephila clavipes]|nr:hypothetical protein TNCV_1115581 [Trichonephila clavipes]
MRWQIWISEIGMSQVQVLESLNELLGRIVCNLWRLLYDTKFEEKMLDQSPMSKKPLKIDIFPLQRLHERDLLERRPSDLRPTSSEHREACLA